MSLSLRSRRIASQSITILESQTSESGFLDSSWIVQDDFISDYFASPNIYPTFLGVLLITCNQVGWSGITSLFVRAREASALRGNSTNYNPDKCSSDLVSSVIHNKGLGKHRIESAWRHIS
jgi:hypothetical protein